MPTSRASKRPFSPPKVALWIETSNAYARGLLAGIRKYVRIHGPWNVHLSEHSRGDRPPKWMTGWDGDGVLARVENKQIARALTGLHVPTVDLSSHRYLGNVPVVTTDDETIARLAFEHFAERGFRNFAYCGDERFAWSVARGGFFDELVRRAGLNCEHYHEAPGHVLDGDVETDAIAGWLSGLPRPTAVFAAYDARGQQVLEACQRAGLSAPEQVAVLGVDNDELLCELAPVPLSSVILDMQRAGWEAAELLSRLMKGEEIESTVHRIPPLGIATRQSTDVSAVEDVNVARAARLIRERACSGIGVADVVAAIPMGRRLLEKRFRAMIGRTLRQEITRVQMLRVKELLVGTELSLAEIADRAGFKYVEYLTFVFKREFGISPSSYRLEHQPQRRRGSPH